jgi:molybdopterin-containing oxidoreductase family membrane subunit
MKPEFLEIDNSTGYYAVLGALGAVAVAGVAAALYMEHHGHIVTGMDNHVVWGMPHVFAVFLIVAASGALNVASIASVFGKAMYKPLAPLSGLLAVALLVGGLAVLVLDLGRPDRLLVAMTHFNFKSIFALNIFLYTGFLAIVVVYLWTMMERRMNPLTKAAGFVAFVWRLLLTTGTGSIFGFLVARRAYDTAVLAPTFVALSFSYGLAIFVLVLTAACRATGRTLADDVPARLGRLQAVFISAVLYFVGVYHATNLYFAGRHGVERFLLADGGVHTLLFWLGQILLGNVLPLAVLLHPRLGRSPRLIALSAAMVVAGGLAQMYVTIIGGQAYPLDMFPGMQMSSSFDDGVVHGYSPSLPEVMLGLGGVAIAGIIVVLALRLLRFLPKTVEGSAADAAERAPSIVAAAQPGVAR